jgi:hypothetical protein
MKFYLVNYIILDNRTVIANENVGITLHNFANITDFKKSIAILKNIVSETEKIVIKSYKQISKEAYKALSTSTV